MSESKWVSQPLPEMLVNVVLTCRFQNQFIMQILFVALLCLGIYLILLGMKNHIYAVVVNRRKSQFSNKQIITGLVLIALYLIFKQ